MSATASRMERPMTEASKHRSAHCHVESVVRLRSGRRSMSRSTWLASRHARRSAVRAVVRRRASAVASAQ